jgi:hypothetical protein
MSRPKNTPGENRVNIGASVKPEIDRQLDELVRATGHTKSRLIELLLLRGLIAYQRDGKLLESREESENDIRIVTSDKVSARREKEVKVRPHKKAQG